MASEVNLVTSLGRYSEVVVLKVPNVPLKDKASLEDKASLADEASFEDALLEGNLLERSSLQGISLQNGN